MELLGSYGRLASGQLSRMRSRGGDLTTSAVDFVVVGAAAAAAGYLSAKSNLKGKGGKIASLPIPLAGTLVLMGAAMAGLGGSEANHHLLSAAKGMFATQAAMIGIKQAYGPTTPPAGTVVSGYPHLGAGIRRGLGGGIGASPETEALFREAGLIGG